MNLPTANNITIAVTVFERTDYIVSAIESALNQTIPVHVIVVEDCASTTRVRDLVIPHFGNRITYYRNPARRGIFGNWNACCDYSGTEWISILHDDDLLAPTFVADMIKLAKSAGLKGAYFCRPNLILPDKRFLELKGYDFPGAWREIDVVAFAKSNLMLFPGQLLHVPSVRAVGGFFECSQFAGDWDMWFKLAFHYGAAQTRKVSATVGTHEGLERGTNRVVRSGRKLGLDFIQSRRNFALLRRKFPDARFDRKEALSSWPASFREIIAILPNLSPRMARYQWALLMQSAPPNLRYGWIRWMAKIIGPKWLQAFATVWRRFQREKSETVR